MTRRTIAAFAALAASLIFGATPGSAWQKDPDRAADPAAVGATIAQLLSPDPTLGNSDTAAIGIGADAVGSDGALTNPPADPPSPSSGHTLYVDQDGAADSDCPADSYPTAELLAKLRG